MPELLDRPVLSRDQQYLMDTYDRLATERPLGFGFGQIPHSAVTEEALRLGLGWDGYHELWYHVQRLDAQWLARANKPKSAEGATGGRLPHSDIRRPVRRGSRKSDRYDGGGEDWVGS